MTAASGAHPDPDLAARVPAAGWRDFVPPPMAVVSADRPIGDLLPLFASTGHHHVPVIDAERRLVGIVTQSDVVARAGAP